jgi:putative transposase
MTPAQLKGATLRSTSPDCEDLVVLGSRLVEGRLEVLGLKSNTTRYEFWETLRMQVVDEIYRVERTGGRTLREQLKASDQDDKKLTEAAALVSLVSETKRTQGLSTNKAYLQLEEKRKASEGASNAAAVELRSRSTVYRRLKCVREGLPLLRGDAAKGNRKPRYSHELRLLVECTAEELYLIPKSRFSIKALTEHLTALAQGLKYIPTAKELSREYVSKVIHEISPDPELERMDTKEAIAGKSIAKHLIRVGAPLERVEQDAVHLPFVAKTPWGVSRDAWLVHAIDCFSSYPLGWYLVVGAVSASNALSCLERAMYPKKHLFDRLGVSGTFDLFGTIGLVIFDNGPENKGERLPRVTRLGIDTMHCRSHAAHGKPFIERLNRSLKEFLETLPGCTRFNGKDAGRDPVAEGDVLPTLDELERDIVGWYYKVWINHELKRLKSAVFLNEFRGKTPVQVLKQYIEVEQHAMPFPPNIDEWRLVRYERSPKTLSRKTGATVEGFHFRGAELERLIKAVGETEVTVLWDPDDFRYVWVPIDEGRDQVRLVNEWIGPSTPGYTYAQAKTLLEQAGSGPNEGEAESLAFKREVLARSAAPQGGPATKSRSKRQESANTTAQARAHNAIERSLRAPPDPPVQAAAPSPAADWWPEALDALDVVDRTSGGKS